MASNLYPTMGSESQFILPNQGSSIQDAIKEKKKRTRNPDLWKKEKRKRAILSGQSYINTRGELVGAKAIGPDCMCKNKCFLGVSEENRKTIFNGFYSLESYDKQNAYLYGLIRRHDIQRKRKPVTERRTCSYKYYVRVKGIEIQVCKKAFAHIHGISDKKIRTLCIKHEQNVLFPRDNRGRHSNRPKKVTPEIVTLIKQHILKMLSGNNGSDFIKTDKNQGPDVNISKLHKNFLQQFEPTAIDTETDKVKKNYNAKVKSWLYFKVFHEEFKSMDFSVVKRKLSDLRRSLEASGTIQPVKKKASKQPKTKLKSEEAPPPKEIAPNVTIYSTVNMPQNSMATVANSQMNCYMTPQPAGLPQHFHLSMLGLQHISNPPHPPQAPFPHHGMQQCQQQPLNLQTGASPAHTDQTTQHIPINIHPVGSHVPSYYLTLGHMSNLIPIPVSTAGPVQGTVGVPQTTNFHPQHNVQQFTSGHIFPTHSMPQPTNIQLQPASVQGNVGVPYSNSGQNHMY